MQVTSCLRYSSPVLELTVELADLYCSLHCVFLRTNAYRNTLSHPPPLHTVGFEMRPLPRIEVRFIWGPLSRHFAMLGCEYYYYQ